MKVLEVNNINVFYDKIHAIKDVSFYINKGEIVSFIGANGAGKSTTLNAISNLLKIKSGEIALFGENISNVKAHKLV
ncbi:ATP-binding cassette domain-containing protein, partial [Streptobacillus moniliformis]